VLFKLVLDILDVATKGARGVDSLPCLNFKLSELPELCDVLTELDLELQLLVS
jgi:hypothetical protein